MKKFYPKSIKFILLFVIIFFLLFSLFGFYNSIRPPKIISKITPQDLGLNYEEISFVTEDNLTLRGWFIPHSGKNDVKTIIFLHGYPADKGNILPTISFLNKDYNLFLFDFRYFGESEGHYSTAGAKEVKDVKAAVEFLKRRGINEVGVWGFSMGGATALMAASQIPEIKAIVSEASYAELDQMTYALYQLPILKYPLGWLTSFWAKVFMGISTKDVSPYKSAKGLDLPILIIHSRNDEIIPFDNALLLQNALKEKPLAEFWFEEHLIHGQFAPEYQKRLQNFFAKNL